MVKPNKVWQPGSTAAIDELAEELRQETIMMMKKAAVEMNCSVEELAVSVANNGMVEVRRMTPEEMTAMHAEEAEARRIMKIKKERGIPIG